MKFPYSKWGLGRLQCVRSVPSSVMVLFLLDEISVKAYGQSTYLYRGGLNIYVLDYQENIERRHLTFVMEARNFHINQIKIKITVHVEIQFRNN